MWIRKRHGADRSGECAHPMPGRERLPRGLEPDALTRADDQHLHDVILASRLREPWRTSTDHPQDTLPGLQNGCSTVPNISDVCGREPKSRRTWPRVADRSKRGMK